MTLLTPKPSKYTSLIIIKLFYTIYKLHITELGKKKRQQNDKSCFYKISGFNSMHICSCVEKSQTNEYIHYLYLIIN